MKTKQFRRRLLVFAVSTGLVATVGIAFLHQPRSAIAEITPKDQRVADSSAILALAKHLRTVGAKMYGAYWCPYCTRQKEMFGEVAFRSIDYVECDPRGQNPRPNLCKAANIKGYPTWEIKGKMYPGVQSFEDLAKASGYRGSQRF